MQRLDRDDGLRHNPDTEHALAADDARQKHRGRLPLLPELVARREMDRLRVGAGWSGCRIARQPQGRSQDRPLDGWPLHVPQLAVLRPREGHAVHVGRFARRKQQALDLAEVCALRSGRDGNKNLFFVTFTSMIPYGYLAKRQARALVVLRRHRQARLRQGRPSFAPVWLPYQDINDGAISPYWTETLPCTVDGANNCIGCVQGEECEVDKDKATCQCTQPRIQ